MERSSAKSEQYIHPSGILMVLVLSGISTLFLALSISYVYTKVDAGMDRISPPLLFVVSTIILLASSYFIHRAKRNFEDQELRQLYYSLWLCLAVTILFLIVQFFAWAWMINNQMSLASGNAIGYLYAISGLHFIHVLAGIPFLLIFGLKIHREIKSNEPTLLFIDDQSRRRLRYISLYWHFVDILWIYLIVFFFVNTLI